MKVSQVLALKGTEVATIKPTDTVEKLCSILADRRFGALVVSNNGSTIDGIVSERDVVRNLASAGGDLLSQPVSTIMTADVKTCTTDDTVDELMTRMTEGRFRHVPVVTDGRLSGLVSISDVVKVRVRQLEHEAEQLERYVTNTW